MSISSGRRCRLAFMAIATMVHGTETQETDGSSSGGSLKQMLAPFIDLQGLADGAKEIFALAEQAYGKNTGSTTAFDVNGTFVPVDNTYPLSDGEMQALLKLHAQCWAPESMALQTWCTGEKQTTLGETDEDDEDDDEDVLCPLGFKTNPCTGRVLERKPNEPVDANDFEFLWPWEGIRCNAYTEPTSVTHIYLPDERMHCRLEDVNLSAMASLEQLDLSSNGLTGPFPSWLSGMTVLRMVNLADNQLRGSIPASFADNEFLEVVNLTNNQLSAPTLGFVRILTRLQLLDLSLNEFALELPAGIFAPENLRVLDLSHNQFKGRLPSLPQLKFLQSIDLSSNALEGEFPTQMTVWGKEDPQDPEEESILEYFDVSDNLLTGEVSDLSNLTSLQHFNVSNNQLHGAIPDLPSHLQTQDPHLSFDGNTFLCSASWISSSCVCGDGYTAFSLGSRRDAKEQSFISKCFKCPRGSYSNATTNQQCKPCPRGSIATTEREGRGASHCQLCSPGTFANRSTGTCELCPVGMFSDGYGANVCHPCRLGMFAATSGSTTCSVCARGTFANHSGSVTCFPCSAGTFTNKTGEAECLKCPVGTFQSASGSASCNQCPKGSIAPFPGHLKCVPCLPGTYYNIQEQACRRCPPNTFTTSRAQRSCQICPSNTTAEGYGNNGCSPKVLPGFGIAVEAVSSIFQFNTSSAAIKSCKPGSYNDGSTLACQSCEPGTFTAENQSHACLPCPRGSFSPDAGARSCIPAPPGTYVDHEGAWRPTRCPPNQFSNTTGFVVCHECVPPSFSLLGGGTICKLAGLGEIYEVVAWPTLTMHLQGVSKSDLASDSSAVTLIQAWQETLSGYGFTNTTLHLQEMASETPEDDLLQITFAVETIPSNALSTKNKSSKDSLVQSFKEKALEVRRFVDRTRDAVDQWVNSFAGFNSSSSSSGANISDLVTSSGFIKALLQQMSVRHVLSNLSPQLLRIEIDESHPIEATRAVACPTGTFFVLNATSQDRTCDLCPNGTYSDRVGAMTCLPCPQGSFSDEPGQTSCSKCGVGEDAPSGSSVCHSCSFFEYACAGFWEDVLLAGVMGLAMLAVLWQRVRELAQGNRSAQERSEGVALLARVRTHGRAYASLPFAPMVRRTRIVGRFFANAPD